MSWEVSLPLTALIFSATMIALKVMEHRKNGKNGATRAGFPMDYAAAQINVLNDLSGTMKEISKAMSTMAENLRHLPTKAEFAQELKDTRHEMRSVVQGAFTTVENQVKEARVDVNTRAEMLQDEIQHVNDILQRRPT